MAREAGFTLIEVIVALGVFSLAAVSLMSVNAQSLRAARVIEEKTLARIVADTVLTEALIDPAPMAVGRTTGSSTQLQRVFLWRRTVTPSPQQGLLIVEVDVRAREDGPIMSRAATLAAAR